MVYTKLFSALRVNFLLKFRAQRVEKGICAGNVSFDIFSVQLWLRRRQRVSSFLLCKTKRQFYNCLLEVQLVAALCLCAADFSVTIVFFILSKNRFCCSYIIFYSFEK